MSTIGLEFINLSNSNSKSKQFIETMIYITHKIIGLTFLRFIFKIKMFGHVYFKQILHLLNKNDYFEKHFLLTHSI